MERRTVNPWTWQEQFGFSQGQEVAAAERVLFLAGQTPTAPDGTTLHVDEMRGQAGAALDNVETVLREAGMSLANIVRMTTYVTDVDRYFAEGAEVVGARLAAAGVLPAATLLGVQRLAFPEFLIELEATAVA